MNERVRIQHYVSRELQRKIQATAAAQGITLSAVTEAALSEYFDRERTDKDWLSRRLDHLSQAVAAVHGSVERAADGVHSDVEFLSEAFGVFVRYVYLRAIAPASADQEQRIESLYQAFLRLLTDPNRRSGTLRRDVRKVDHGAVPTGRSGPDGGRQ